MFFRIRAAFMIALLVTLITSITAFAKGNFAFISITGPKLKEAVRATDSALTYDFFAFADFYRDKAAAPADPGPGYEVTRYYVDARGEVAFDHLHYYPDTGFVYYDGIANGGSSEYDRKWYTAKPEIKTPFENALPDYARSAIKSQPAPGLDWPRSTTLIAPIAGLVIIGLFAFRFRKLAPR